MSGSGCLTDGRRIGEGLFQVSEDAMHDAPAGLPAEAAREGRTGWRSFLPPLALSLFLHAIALGLLGQLLLPQRQSARPEQAVSLTAVIVTPPAPRVPVPEPSNAPAPVDSRAPIAPVAPVAPPQPAIEAKPEAPVAAAPQEPARAAREPPPEPSRPPVPQDDPFAGQVRPELVSRRLAAKVWIREDGSVDEARVRANEIPPELVTWLQEGLARVRFAADAGEPAGARRLVDVLLCFNQTGALEATDAECWTPGSTAPR